ncbi:MAG: hypothetical protein O2822_06315 [Chloroflexi bacterium]|nr:hypothetical protein [Chloroflexota bacterium]
MPPILEWSEGLGRLTRTEPVEDQGVLTWDLVRRAILDGRPDEAIAWLRYIQDGENYVRPGGRPMSMSIQGQLAYIGRRWGEDHVESALRYWRRKLIVAGGESTYAMTPLQRLQHHVEVERADYAGGQQGLRVHEEADRYVLTAERCAGCLGHRSLAADAATEGVTSRPRVWSWGEAGIPYFTAHLCLWWEVMAIEDIGYPVRIHEVAEDAARGCRVLFYKTPEAIPEACFTRVGATRDPSRFA